MCDFFFPFYLHFHHMLFVDLLDSQAPWFWQLSINVWKSQYMGKKGTI